MPSVAVLLPPLSPARNALSLTVIPSNCSSPPSIALLLAPALLTSTALSLLLVYITYRRRAHGRCNDPERQPLLQPEQNRGFIGRLWDAIDRTRSGRERRRRMEESAKQMARKRGREANAQTEGRAERCECRGYLMGEVYSWDD